MRFKTAGDRFARVAPRAAAWTDRAAAGPGVPGASLAGIATTGVRGSGGRWGRSENPWTHRLVWCGSRRHGVTCARKGG